MLSVKDLKVYFFSDERVARAVDGVSYEVRKGETVCLVGESGCGKTVSALTIMRILPMPPGRIMGGSILFKGQNLLDLNEEEMQKVRGKRIAMIFQEPMTSLNPVFTIGDQIGEAIAIHEKLGDEELRSRCIQLLRDVGIPSPEERLKDYPHQLSGGQRQRVMIAMALACNPDLVIADEPATALDVTIQAQILSLFRELKKMRGMSLLYITHDLRVVSKIADRIYVMYASLYPEPFGVTAEPHEEREGALQHSRNRA
jgi:ABC-type dipeptide/oligopeptide/nickel transport system ATPase component